jgi:hypothetical protein
MKARSKAENSVDPSNPSNRRRSERVMLHVSVVVWVEKPEGGQSKEETQTLVVNAHGGLLKLRMEVQPGQPLRVVNTKSGMEERAKVVRVDRPPGGHSAVAFEFERPAPNFWPVVFPPSDWKVPSL